MRLFILILSLMPIIGKSQWQLISQPVGIDHQFNDVSFVNNDTGIVTGFMNGQAGWMQTKDGGVSWDTTYVFDVCGSILPSPRKCQFVNDTTAFIFCTYKIFRTSDCGLTWQQMDTGGVYNNSLGTIDGYFVNKDTGFLAWSDGGAGGLRSEDGGVTWIDDPNLMGARNFTDYNGSLVACQGGASIYDYFSSTWGPAIYSFENSNYTYYAAIKVANKLIFVGGKSGGGSTGIYCSSFDNGSTWEPRELGSRLHDIHFINDSTGHMYGSFLGSLRTSDYGQTWFETEVDNSSTGMSETFVEFDFIDENNAYGVSDNGIYKTTNGGGLNQGLVMFWPPDLGMQSNFSKSIVYPNPATDQLNLQIDGAAVLNVRIYNLQGALVKEFETFSPVLDISDLSSGTFIGKIETTQKVQYFNFVKR